jgi:hypothetical protein
MGWFANKGQVLQVIAAVVSAVIALINVFVAKEKVPSVVVLAIALGWLTFSVIMFFRNRAQTAEIKTAAMKAAAASMGKIPFNYLPQESPSGHGWALLKEDATGIIPPTFSSLSASAPVTIGLSIRPNGWYGMDYLIVEAQKTRCNRLIFAANFGIDGKVYAFLHMPSRIVGGTPEERWIQMGVNVGPDRIEGDEGIVGIIGKELRDGWVSFDVSLVDIVERAFGKRQLFYGEHGKLLKIRFRGSLSISEVEFYRG